MINAGAIVVLDDRHGAVLFGGDGNVGGLLVRLGDAQVLAHVARRQSHFLGATDGDAGVQAAALAAGKVLRKRLDQRQIDGFHRQIAPIAVGAARHKQDVSRADFLLVQQRIAVGERN